MPLTPAQVADKWASNLGRATETIRAGVNSVSVNPAEKAIAAQDRYVAGVERAVADGRYARGLQRVSLQDWKNAILEKGLPRIASGANQAKPKMQSFLQEFLPYVEEGVRALENMPRGDLQQNIQRAIRMIEHNANFRRS